MAGDHPWHDSTRLWLVHYTIYTHHLERYCILTLIHLLPDKCGVKLRGVTRVPLPGLYFCNNKFRAVLRSYFRGRASASGIIANFARARA